MLSCKKIIILFLLFCKNEPCYAHYDSHKKDLVNNPQSLYENLVLDQLLNFGKFNTNSLKEKPSIWILFQPNCSSCESQLRDLTCLPEEVAQIAVGFWGSREKLNKLLQFSKFKGQKLMANPTFEKRVFLKQTPTILIVDPKGSVIYQTHSLTSCSKLKSYFVSLKSE